MKIQEINNAIALALKLTGYVNDVLVGYLDIPLASFTAPQVLLTYAGIYQPGNTIVLTATSDLLSDMTILIDGEIVALLHNVLTLIYSYTIPADTDFTNISAGATNSVGLSDNVYLNLESLETYAVQSISLQLPNYNPAFQLYLYATEGIAENLYFTTQEEAAAVTAFTNAFTAEQIPELTHLDELRNFTSLTTIPLAWAVSLDMQTYTIIGATNLQSIVFPDSLTTIGATAFMESGLISLEIPEGVTSIDIYSFTGSPNLTSILVSPDNSVFDSRDNCNAIIETASNKLIFGTATTAIPNSVTTIGEHAFDKCRGLTSITIPNNITSIGQQAFSGCTGLTSITIGNGVTSVGEEAFSGCDNIETADINSQAALDAIAYHFTDKLTSIILGDGVTSIGMYAFRGCTGLTSVTIPNSVTSIGNYAFDGCTGLTSINVAEDNLNYASIDGVLYNKDKNTLITCPMGKTGSITIPNSVTNIGENAFSGCSGLTSATIGDGVTSLLYNTFSGCTSLTSVYIGSGVYFIRREAFSGCTALTHIEVSPNNSTYDSRDNCNAIIETASNTLELGFQSTVIPSTVTTIELWAFADCTSLLNITIPNTVTTIGRFAFKGTGLTAITLPNSITTWNDNVFADCTSLRSVVFNSGVTTVPNAYFNRCTSLIQVTIPDSVTIIEAGAFDGCTALPTIAIPDSVTTIGNYAFRNTSLVALSVGATTPPTITTDATTGTFANVDTTIPVYVPAESVSAYLNSAWGLIFSNIQSGTAYAVLNFDSSEPNYNDIFQMFLYEGGVVPTEDRTTMAEAAAVTELPAGLFMDATIRTCNELQYFTNLTAIKNNCFDNSYLEEIIIPASVTSIETYAFHGCGYNNYLTATILSTTPPTLGANAFDSAATIKVPAESVSAYQNAAGWSSYNIVPIS